VVVAEIGVGRRRRAGSRPFVIVIVVIAVASVLFRLLAVVLGRATFVLAGLAVGLRRAVVGLQRAVARPVPVGAVAVEI
jgi:hypothetical protein